MANFQNLTNLEETKATPVSNSAVAANEYCSNANRLVVAIAGATGLDNIFVGREAKNRDGEVYVKHSLSTEGYNQVVAALKA